METYTKVGANLIKITTTSTVNGVEIVNEKVISLEQLEVLKKNLDRKKLELDAEYAKQSEGLNVALTSINSALVEAPKMGVKTMEAIKNEVAQAEALKPIE
jgi:hypothetical protein